MQVTEHSDVTCNLGSIRKDDIQSTHAGLRQGWQWEEQYD